MSDVLQKGNVTFMSGTECRNYINNIAKLDREVRDASQICAANFLTNTDTCQVGYLSRSCFRLVKSKKKHLSG